MKTTYFSLQERLQVADWGGKLKSGAVFNISLCIKFQCSECTAKHFLQCSLRHVFCLPLLNVTYLVVPVSVQILLLFSQYGWAESQSKVLLAELFVPGKAWASFLLEAPRWWQRQHFCCVSQGDSVALWIFPLALWYRALSILLLFYTAAVSITGVCWYDLLEGCSADSWGLSINRHKQRCSIE